MTVRIPRLGAALAPLMLAALLPACHHTTPAEVNPAVKFLQPTDGQAIKLTDDEDAATPGVQYTVKAVVTNVTSSATATLYIDGSAISGAKQTLNPSSGEATAVFAKVTFPTGGHTLTVKVDDAGSGKKGQASVAVTVEGGTCAFLSPTDGQTLAASNDVDAATPGMQAAVKVSCPGATTGMTAVLNVAVLVGSHRQNLAPVTTAFAADGTATFASVPLGEGRNALGLQALDAANTSFGTAQITVNVDTGACSVVLGDANGVIYNALGGTPPDPTETRPVVADADPGTAGIQETFTAYTTCAAGSTASLQFGGQDAGTATVASDGSITFSGATIPDGDPVTEVVSVAETGTNKTGQSQPNSYGVDSVIPQLRVTAPADGSTLSPADDLDANTAGIQIHVSIHAASGVSDPTWLGVDDDLGGSLIAAASSTVPASGDFTFSSFATVSSSTHGLKAKAIRRLGNVGTSPVASITVLDVIPDGGSSDGGLVLPALSISSPSAGTVNVFADHGDHTTYAAFEVVAQFASPAPAGTTIHLCSNVAAPNTQDGGQVTTCANGTDFEVPGTLQDASGLTTVDYTNFPFFGEGAQDVYAEAINSAIATEDSASVHWLVDTVPPAVASAGISEDTNHDGAVTGAESPAGNDLHLAVTFTGEEDGGQASITENGADAGSATVIAGAANFTLSNPADGQHTFTIGVVDAAGNPNSTNSAPEPYSDPNQTLTVNVQRNGPSIILVSPAFTTCNAANDADPSTPNTCEVVFAVRVGASATSVTFSGNNGITCDTPTGPDANGDASTTCHLPQGNSTMTATATDALGNSSTLPVAMSVDTIAPTVTWVSPDPNGTVGQRTFTSQSFQVTVQTSGAEQGQTVTVSSTSGGVVGTGTVQADGSATFTVNLQPTPNQTLSATVTDAAGNTSAAATVDIVLNLPGCAIAFTNPTSSTVTLNVASTNTMTVTGHATPGTGISASACQNQAITFSYTNSNGTTNVGSGSTDASGNFSVGVTFPDQLSSTFTAQMSVNQTTSASFVANVDVTAPQISLNSPQLYGSTNLYVVAATGNINVSKGVPGYVADADGSTPGAQLNMSISVSNGGDAVGNGTGTLTISLGSNPTPLATATISGNGTVTVVSPTNFNTLQLPETLSDSLTVRVTDAAGNTSNLTWSLRVRSIAPDAPTLVTSNPGNGVYTHTVEYHHADLEVTWTPPSDPLGAPLSYDVVSATQNYLNTYYAGPDGGGYLNDTSATYATHADAGAANDALLTHQPTFNNFEVAARTIDGVGNVSTLSAPGYLSATWLSYNLTYTGPAASGASFGQTILVGNVDGKGGLDLAVGANEPDNSGSVTIFYGGSQASAQRLSGAANAYFGEPFALGDLNGDGFDDLVAYNADHLEIFLASPDGGGLPATPNTSLTGDSNVYLSSVVPDVTGDGVADLVLGDPYANTNAGKIYVIRGRSTWPATLDITSSSDVIINGAAASGNLGAVYGKGSIAVPNPAGGANDLVVPAPGANTVYLFRGGATLLSLGLTGSVSSADAVFTSSSAPSGSDYGVSLLSYDTSGDGQSDVLISNVGGTGQIFSYPQTATGYLPDAGAPPLLSGPTNFGLELRKGDIDDDGIPDLLVIRGAPAGLGSMNIYIGQSSGVAASQPASALYTNSLDATGADSAVGDVTGDGQPDILMSNSSTGNGYVQVFH